MMHLWGNLRNGMSQGDLELLLPNRILRIGDDPGPGYDGAAEADGDVGVSGDDLAVVVAVAAAVDGEGFPAVERGEEAAEALRDQIHVGQAPSFHDFQLQVAMEAYDFSTVARHSFLSFVRGGGRGGGWRW